MEKEMEKRGELTEGNLVADVGGLSRGLPVETGGVALENGPLEHASTERGSHVGGHAHGASRLTENSDALWITAKAAEFFKNK